MKNKPFIRKAIPGDEAGIHHAHMRSIREICVKDHGKEEIKGWGYRPLGERWITPIKESFVRVIEYQKEIHGVLYFRIISEKDKRIGYLHALYLTPEVTNFGLGKKLMDMAFDEAKKHNLKSIELESTITAFEFYKKCGFKQNGPKNRGEIGGYPVTSFPMIYYLENDFPD